MACLMLLRKNPCFSVTHWTWEKLGDGGGKQFKARALGPSGLILCAAPAASLSTQLVSMFKAAPAVLTEGRRAGRHTRVHAGDVSQSLCTCFPALLRWEPMPGPLLGQLKSESPGWAR